MRWPQLYHFTCDADAAHQVDHFIIDLLMHFLLTYLMTALLLLPTSPLSLVVELLVGPSHIPERFAAA